MRKFLLLFYPFLARRLRPLRDTTEKLTLHTIYSTVKLTNILYFVLIYTKKTFSVASYRWGRTSQIKFAVFLKYAENCNAYLAESIFQTCSRIQRVLNLLQQFQFLQYQKYLQELLPHLGIRKLEELVQGGYFSLQDREGQVKQ